MNEMLFGRITAFNEEVLRSLVAASNVYPGVNNGLAPELNAAIDEFRSGTAGLDVILFLAFHAAQTYAVQERRKVANYIGAMAGNLQGAP